MPPKQKKPSAASSTVVAAVKGKPGRKRAVDLEEIKDEEHKNLNEGSIDADAVSEVDQEEELAEKYGLHQLVRLDLQLPTEEKEYITEYEMRFIDRYYQDKQLKEAKGEGAIEQNPETLAEASIEYEAKLSDVIVYLKKCGYPLENCFVAMYSPIFSAYVNCGLDPLPQSIKITKEDLIVDQNDQYCLRLKFIWGIRSDDNEPEESGAEEEQMMTQSINESSAPRKSHRNAMASSQKITTAVDPKSQSRNKERSIRYIIEKVSQWRKLYNGYMDENHVLKRMSLEDAAAKVAVSKKSLDDYLSQLRQGRALGFNFNARKDDKVGILRQFVKQKSAENQSLQPKASSNNQSKSGNNNQSVLGKRSANQTQELPQMERRTSQREVGKKGPGKK